MVLDHRAVGELRRALPQEGEGPLVEASLVEDPAQGVRNVGVLWGRLFGVLRELERLLLVPAMLRIEPGEIVGRRSEARLLGEDFLVSLLSLSDVAFAVVDCRGKGQSRHVLGFDLEQLVELRQGLIELSRGRVKTPESDVRRRQARIELDCLEVCPFRALHLLLYGIGSAEEEVERTGIRHEGDLLLDSFDRSLGLSFGEGHRHELAQRLDKIGSECQ